tara:strand:- start:376 stop:1668 length:1293 start_codon:yes stop_codon:yes gene_type:complete
MKIISVKQGSTADSIGIKPGDRLMKINSTRVKDEIDYRFKITEEEVSLEFEIDGKLKTFDIQKDYDDDLGVELEEFKIKSCANDCVFCFVDQNPAGMRKGMYFRDGDFRLSYLHGHYVTMTNMGEKQLKRIVEQKLSPLYISVHATGVELRKKLLLYGKDDHLLNKIDYLTKNGIELHAQIVLMPSINDGAHLIKTIDDLHSFYPGLNSLTIVPVGLTKHREGLPEIETVSPEYAVTTMGQIESLNKKFKTKSGRPFMYLSDEWYILSKTKLPPYEYYSPLDLVENGVGQVSKFLEEFSDCIEHLPKTFDSAMEFSIVTGKLMEGIFKKYIIPKLLEIKNLKINLYAVDNDFYGDMVTVSGLLTGKDIINSLKGKRLGQAVWASNRILNDEGTLTLDDMTLEDISKNLGVPFNVSNDSIFEIFERNIIGK